MYIAEISKDGENQKDVSDVDMAVSPWKELNMLLPLH